MKNLFCGAALLGSIAVQAQTSTVLDSVTIVENRFQASLSKQNKNIQVITAKEINALPVKSANELLAYAAGVDLRQRGPSGTQSDISIDGSTFDQVLVLVNGVKMSDPQTGHHLMNLPIPLSSIDHIEILRGPAAYIYGVNALAGAINIVTKLPQTDEVSARIYAGSSMQTDTSNGDTYYGWGVQASGSIARKKHAHTLSVAHDEGNGYRYNTAFDAYRLFYQNKITLSKKSTIDAMGGFIHNEFGANGYYSSPGDVNSVETVQTATGSIRYTYKPNDKLTISPRISYRYNNDDYIYVRSKPELYHNVHETNVVTGEVQSSLRTKHGHAGAGIEWRNEAINSTNLGKRSRDNMGIYAEYKHNITNALSAGVGVYVNYNSDYDWQLFPGVDAGYKIDKHWKLFADASMGQRLPTYTDLYYKGPVNIGNDQLKPEMASFVQGGVKYSDKLLSGQVSYFYRHTSNFIDWVRANATDPWQPRNFQDVHTNGWTVNANYELGRQLNVSWYKSALLVNYTYLDPRIDAPGSETSKYSIEALRHQATASLKNTFIDKINLNVTGRYLYRINANDYTILDLRIGYQQKWWMLYADLNNLLDTQYKEIGAVPMPGRWYTVGFMFNKR
jgi:Outer membrane cobalamin receptor protein